MTHKAAYAALKAIGQINALLTYQIGELRDGSRLSQLTPELNRLQQALSHVNALLIMNPDERVTFGTMSEAEIIELEEQVRELEEITTPPRAPVPVVVIAEPKDKRRISKEIADGVDGEYVAYPIPGNRYALDISHQLYARLGYLDPYDEGFEYLDDEPVYDETQSWFPG